MFSKVKSVQDPERKYTWCPCTELAPKFIVAKGEKQGERKNACGVGQQGKIMRELHKMCSIAAFVFMLAKEEQIKQFYNII